MIELGAAMVTGNEVAGVGLASRISAILSSTVFTPVASALASPWPPMCMKKTLGSSKKK